MSAYTYFSVIDDYVEITSGDLSGVYLHPFMVEME